MTSRHFIALALLLSGSSALQLHTLRPASLLVRRARVVIAQAETPPESVTPESVTSGDAPPPAEEAVATPGTKDMAFDMPGFSIPGPVVAFVGAAVIGGYSYFVNSMGQ